VLVAGCAGKAPKVEEGGLPPAALNPRQAQLAYHHFSDAALLFSMGEYAEAAEAYERALRHDPASYEIRLSLAECYFRLRQFPRAVSIAHAHET
jgi:tetratricopeptide (TPR) repeat protein